MPRNNYSVAVVCSSNVNRSMEAHLALSRRGFNVQSFGAGPKVRLCGKSRVEYEFGTRYDCIYTDLVQLNEDYYRRRGVLYLMARNSKIKGCPERFQDSEDKFDVVITLSQKIFGTIVEFLGTRRRSEGSERKLVHIINIEVKDSFKDSKLGGMWTCELLSCMPEDYLRSKFEMKRFVGNFAKRTRRLILYEAMYY